MENVENLGIIPARYASSRFPGKPLALISGVTMIERVYKQALKSNLNKVIVATDDERIAHCVRNFSGEVVLTDPHLPSGTDRCREALKLSNIDAKFVINIQGDEPMINPKQIDMVLKLLENPKVKIATLISPATTQEEVENQNRVKVTIDKDGMALYFSRLPIPFAKAEEQKLTNYHIHLGIYGFKTATLYELGMLSPSTLEISESLEQLRWLENGFSIYTDKTKERADSVDTPEDLQMIEKKFFL